MQTGTKISLFSTTALAGLLGVSVLLTSAGPARADCAPDPAVDGDAVVCTGVDTNGFDQFTTNMLDLTVDLNATVNGKLYPSIIGTDFMVGVGIGSDGIIVNNGQVLVAPVTSSHVDAVRTNENGNVTNFGTIETQGGVFVSGISVGLGSVVTNNGTIRLIDAGQPVGIAGASSTTNNGLIDIFGVGSTNRAIGILAAAPADVTNSGTINLDRDTPAGTAFGIFAAIEFGTITNTGAINLNNFGSATGISASLFTNSSQILIENSGTIVIQNSNSSTGIVATSGATIVNSGLISVDGPTARGIFINPGFQAVSDITNTGEIISNDAAIFGSMGIENVVNSGTITGDILLGGGNDLLTNSGRITGTVDLGSGGDLLNNSGIIEGTGTFGNAIILSGSGASVTNEATGIIRTTLNDSPALFVDAIDPMLAPTVTNLGLIEAGGSSSEAIFGNTINLVNEANGVIAANGFNSTAILLISFQGTFINRGLIQANGISGEGVRVLGDLGLPFKPIIENQIGGIIEASNGGNGAVRLDYAKLVNAGTVKGGVVFESNAELWNQASGEIEGGITGTDFGPSSLVNEGSITGGVSLGSLSTINNSGTIRDGFSSVVVGGIVNVVVSFSDPGSLGLSVLTNSGSILGSEQTLVGSEPVSREEFDLPAIGVKMLGENTLFVNTSEGVVQTTGIDSIGVQVVAGDFSSIRIENAGVINGGIAAIIGDTGNETVVNTGTLQHSQIIPEGGTIFRRLFAPDFVVLAGISLLAGDDEIINSGTILSSIDGGAGFDTLTNGLGGSIIGNITNFENISNSGTLTIVNGDSAFSLGGDLTLDGTSALTIQMNAGGPVPIQIAGAATLAGSLVVQFSFSPDIEVLPGDRFTLLTAVGGITGSFGSLDLGSNLFIEGSLIQTANGVELELVRSSFLLPFFDAGRRAIASQLDGVAAVGVQGQAGEFIRALTFTERALAGQIIDQLATRAAADVATPVIEARHLFLSELSVQAGRLADLRGLEGRWVTSVTGYGEFGESAGLDYATGGAMAVSAYGVNDRLTVGFAVAGTASDLEIDSQIGDNGHTALDIAAFAGWQNGGLSLTGALGASYNETNTERSVLLAGFQGRASGSAEGAGYSAAVDARYDIAIGNSYIVPQAAIRVAGFHHGAYEETELGNLGLLIGGRTLTSARASAGLVLKHEFKTSGGFSVVPEIGAFYEREFGDRSREVSASLIADPTSSFPIIGRSADRERFRASGGFSAHFSNSFSANIRYEGAFGMTYDIHRVIGGLRVNW